METLLTMSNQELEVEKITRRSSQKMAYSLDLSLVERLKSKLENHIEETNLKFKVKFADESTLETRNLKFLMDQPNQGNLEIKELSILQVGIEKSVCLYFSEGLVSSSLEGPPEFVLELERFFETEKERIRNWYTPLASEKASWVLAMTAVAIIAPLWVTTPHADSLSGTEKLLGSIIIGLLIGIVGSIIIDWFIERIQSKLFPRSIFLVGRGEEKKEASLYYRRIALTIIVVPVLTAVAKYFWAHI